MFSHMCESRGSEYEGYVLVVCDLTSRSLAHGPLRHVDTYSHSYTKLRSRISNIKKDLK
jgi:hypothetical protein